MRARFRAVLPYPVAISYKRIGACPEPDASRLLYILKSAEMLARLLGLLAVADMRRVFSGRPMPASSPRDKLGAALRRPTFGSWLWILRTAMELIVDAGEQPFLPQLQGICLDTNGKPSCALRCLGELVTVRNRFAHDGVPQDEWLHPRQIPAACETSLPLLDAALQDALFLEDYPLVFISPIKVEKKRGAEPLYQRTTAQLTGHSDLFDMECQVSGNLTETAEVLVHDPARGRHLNLDPFVVYSDEGTEERVAIDGSKNTIATNILDVFLYNGARGKHFSYLACNKGGELASHRCSRCDYLESGFRGFFALLDDAAAAASEAHE